MKPYIDKDALVAEIKRQLSSIDKCPKLTDNQIAVLEGNKVVLTKLLSFLDTIEVKEVDLDDKDEWKNTGGFGSTWDPDSPDYYPD